MDNSVEIEIVNAIKILSDNTSTVTSRKKPTKRVIFDYVKGNNENFNENLFTEASTNLESRKKIYHREGKDKYYISDTDNTQSQEKQTDDAEERDLIDMIKCSMLEEKLKDREIINLLKDELNFLKTEIIAKNNIITDLMHSVKLNISTVETRCCMHSNRRDECNITASNNERLKNDHHSGGLNSNISQTELNDKEHSKNTKDVTRKDYSDDVDDATRKHSLPNIEVIGDSDLSAINPKGLSNKNNVVVRNHPGSTTEDIKSHIIPSLKKNRDLIIIHTGTNDITNKVETILNLQSIVNTIKKKSANTKICISSLFVRKDKKGIEIKVSELNRQLKTFCEENLIHFLSNENIDESCLGRGKLHLNRKGSKLFALNLISFMKPFY